MGYKILVVDDEKTIRHLFSRILEMHDYQVCTAESGEQGTEVFGKENPDLVLTDASMDRGNGIYLTREVRKYSQVPIVMLTGHYTSGLEKKFKDVGGNEILQKPIGMQEVVDLAERYVRH